MFFKWANWTVWINIFDDEIPNMKTTVFESLLSSCATEGYSLVGHGMNIYFTHMYSKYT